MKLVRSLHSKLVTSFIFQKRNAEFDWWLLANMLVDRKRETSNTPVGTKRSFSNFIKDST